MKIPYVNKNETERLHEFEALDFLDTEEIAEFDFLTEMASQVCGTKIALVSLVATERQWFLSHHGLAVRETPREFSFCAHALERPEELMEVEDARMDTRFCDNPLVVGDPHIVFYAGFPLVTESGHPLGTLCVIDDVPKQLTAEHRKLLKKLARQAVSLLELRRKNNVLKQERARLQEVQRMLEQTSRMAQVGGWEKDFESGTDNWSPVTRAIHEVGPDFVPKMDNSLAFYKEGEHRQRVVAAVEHTMASGAPFDVEVILITARGRERWVRAVGNARMRDGKCVGLYGIFQDITEQRRALTRLKQLSIVAENTTNGVLFTDNERRITWSNEGFTEITGYAAHEVLGRSPSFLQGKGTDPDALERIKAKLNQGEGFHEVLLNYSRSGRPYWNEIEVKPYYDEKDERIGYFAIQSDVTAKKHAEERLQQSAKRDAIERLAGGMAHDFNNFLANMTLSAEILREEPSLSPEGRGQTQTLLNEIGAATTVARQLLAFSKVQPAKVEELDLGEFLTASAEFAVRGSSTTFSVEGVEALDRHHTNRDILQQILFNLIINARQVMGERGHVTLRLVNRDDPNWQCLEVEDCGPGIPTKHQAQLFEAYYTTRKEGSGLGLYVVRTLIERLGGRVAVRSILGEGTCFSLRLPRRVKLPAADDVTLQTVSEATPTGRVDEQAPPDVAREVWLLEDDKRQSALVMTLISNDNLRARAFFSGEDLLAALEELDPADLGAARVFILDITIRGGLGGLDVCQSVRERLPEARITLVSGYSEDWEQRRLTLDELKIDFLAKPYRLAELREKIMIASPLPKSSSLVRIN